MGERRLATYAERATWGTCPACKAEPGQPCNSDVGIALGANIDGQRPSEGVHLGRIQRAPTYVQLVEA
jgi:hypothetical protein